ncbi:putative glycosyltransferase AGO61 [Hordeum vulgare]|nr:putative glycosyltransferase AGO61 [Hordeum vulgare]
MACTFAVASTPNSPSPSASSSPSPPAVSPISVAAAAHRVPISVAGGLHLHYMQESRHADPYRSMHLSGVSSVPENNRAGDEAEVSSWIEPGTRAASSWDSRANVDVDVLQGHGASPVVLSGSRSDPSQSSPESVLPVVDPELKSGSVKFKTYFEKTAVPNHKSNITCYDKGKDKGFPYARPVVCKMFGDVPIAPGSSSVILTMPQHQGAEG